MSDAIQRSRVVGDVVQRAIWSDLEVDHASGLVVELVHRGDVAVRVEVRMPDESLGVVAEEQVSCVLGRERAAAVHRATGDGRALTGVRVGMDRVDETGAGRRAHPLLQRPPVVAALDDPIDLLPAEVAHVAAVEVPGDAVELEAPGVAESVRPDLSQLAGLAGERVVGWDGAVLVDPQDLPVRTVQVLSVRAVAVVTDCEVELAVGAEPDAPAHVQLQ